MAFIDLEKAYDTVPHNLIWNCLRLKNVPEEYIDIVKAMYKDSSLQVRCTAGTTEAFSVGLGVKQGSALSPLLFLIIMDTITADIQKQVPCNMLFADDIMLCDNTREGLEALLNEWVYMIERNGLRVSRKKTEYLRTTFNGEVEDNQSIHIAGTEVSRVKEFNNLGSTVNSSGTLTDEIRSRT